MVGTNAQVIAPDRTPDQGDLAKIGARTSVRAAGDTEVDGLIAQPVALEQHLQPIEKLRHVAFALRHRQATGRQCHAGNRVPADAAVAPVVIEAMALDQRIDRCAICLSDVGDDEILVAGHAELALVHAGDLAHAGLARMTGQVRQPPGGYLQGEVMPAVLALDPAEAIAVVQEAEGAWLLDPEVEA